MLNSNTCNSSASSSINRASTNSVSAGAQLESVSSHENQSNESNTVITSAGSGVVAKKKVQSKHYFRLLK